MDLSGVSTADLQAYQSGDLSKVSTDGLVALHQLHETAAPAPTKGNDGGQGVAFGEGLANAVPAGQKITSAIGAVGAKALSPFTGDDRSIGDLYNQAQADTKTTADANKKSAFLGSAAGVISAAPIFGAAGKAVGGALGGAADALTGGNAGRAAGALSDLGTAAPEAGFAGKTGALAARAAGRSITGAAGAYPVGALYGASNEDWGKGSGAVADAAAEGGKTAAGYGAAIGAGLPVVGAGLGVAADALGPAGRAVKGVVAPAAAAQADQDAAMGKIIKRINADFPDPAQRQAALEKAITTPGVGIGESLAGQGGKTTENLAMGAAQYPEGKAAAQGYFDDRVSGAPARIAKTFADQVSSNNDYFGTLDSIMEKGRQAAAPLYNAAFKVKAVVSPVIDKILDTPAGKTALADARNYMLNDQSMMGVADKELGEQMRDAVQMGKMAAPDSRGVAAGLNMRSLDYVKKALDKQIQDAYRSGDNHGAGIINDMKNSLVKEMDNSDPSGSYAKARAVSGDYIRNSKAMDDGRDFMKPGTAGQPEQIAAKFKALGPTEQESYKAGMVRAVKEAMDKPSADQPNYYSKIFGSTDMQNRLKAVLNDSEYSVLSNNMEEEKNLYKFKYDVLGNSRTSEKQISAQEFEDGGKDFRNDLMNRGPKDAVIKKGTQWVMSMFDGMSNKTAGQVSKILYETDPAKKLEILKSIQKNAQLDPAEKQTAVKAYFSVNSLFKNLSKTQAGVQGGEQNE